ncbi:MAG TPA: response regulator [Methanoregulaceae archaeon]|nr:response regulator [Methanoregulaceae archaeon]
MIGTILVVDDNTYIVDGLVAILKKKGYHTMAAHSGEETLTQLKAGSPDLVLLDISMEPMDGWETLERIRKDPSSSLIPVIIFSARKKIVDEIRQTHLAVDAVIAKPINTGLLLNAIERVLQNKNEKKENITNKKEIMIKLGFDHHLHDS